MGLAKIALILVPLFIFFFFGKRLNVPSLFVFCVSMATIVFALFNLDIFTVNPLVIELHTFPCLKDFVVLPLYSTTLELKLYSGYNVEILTKFVFVSKSKRTERVKILMYYSSGFTIVV